MTKVIIERFRLGHLEYCVAALLALSPDPLNQPETLNPNKSDEEYRNA